MQSSFLGSGLRSSTQRCCVPSRVSPVASTVVAHYGGRANLGGGKAWERTETNQNGKPVKVKMHVKKGDIVQVISGKDKGTVAEVEKVIATRGMVVVKGVNITVRNVAPRTKDEQGQQKRQESPIHHSNVMHFSLSASKRSRVGYKVAEDGRKVRYLVKTGEELADRSFKQPAAESSSRAATAAPVSPQQAMHQALYKQLRDSSLCGCVGLMGSSCWAMRKAAAGLAGCRLHELRAAAQCSAAEPASSSAAAAVAQGRMVHVAGWTVSMGFFWRVSSSLQGRCERTGDMLGGSSPARGGCAFV
ncbi:translation protein SH3-like domain-containing protein [Scenedesmus sp. NREL 46B-D3]|nr:translation protein SH3-like domain-containing protein [Scenedesmus sp. NREL 46B-D3]